MRRTTASFVARFIPCLAFALVACGGGGGGFHPITGGDDGGGLRDLSAQFSDDGLKMMVCAPGGAPICDGDAASQTCRADGSGYDSTPCPDATLCVAGVCSCIPGDRSCAGQDVMECGMDGQLHKLATCPLPSVCATGTCGDKRCPEETMLTNANALPTLGWPRFRHDNRNSGVTPAIVAAMPKLKWKKAIGGTNLNGPAFGLAGGPVVNQNDIIFIGGGDHDGMNGAFYSLDSTGKLLYTFAGMRGYGFTTPAVRQDGTAYFSTADGHAYAVDPMGKQAWSFAFGFQNDCHPIVTRDGNVIYGSDAGQLFALDPTGQLLWKSDMNTGPGEVDSALAESCDGKIYAGGANGWVQLDAKTGVTNWKVATTGPFHALMSSPTVTGDGVMYGVDSGGVLYALDPKGKVLWQKNAGPAGAAMPVLYLAGMLYVVLNDGNLHAIDAANGAEKWQMPVGQTRETYVHAGPVADGNQHLYFNSTDGNLYAFDTTGKQLWKQPHSGISSTGCCYGNIAIGTDGTLYVPGNDGTLYAFK